MRSTIIDGLREWGLPTEKAELLGEYLTRLLKKNEVMNLTAITQPLAAAQLHILDSAALLRCCELRGKKVVDVGTGAGLPGMVLRIMEPDFDLTLLDSLGKRIDWLQETCDAMALQRVSCIHARAEEFAQERRESFDLAVSRAVAQLNVLCELSLPLVRVGGRFLAMKSVDSEQEIRDAKRAVSQLGGRIEGVWDYTIPQTEISHRVVIIEKIRTTPRQFPRQFAKIKKSPL